MAKTLHELGDRAEALRLYRHALEKRDAVLGSDHPDTLRVEHLLAGMLHEIEKFEEAKDLYRQIKKVQERMLAPEHRDTL